MILLEHVQVAHANSEDVVSQGVRLPVQHEIVGGEQLQVGGGDGLALLIGTLAEGEDALCLLRGRQNEKLVVERDY